MIDMKVCEKNDFYTLPKLEEAVLHQHGNVEVKLRGVSATQQCNMITTWKLRSREVREPT